MRIAIDVRAIFGERAGKGGYVFEIIKKLARQDRKNQYFLYTQRGKLFGLPPNFRNRALHLPGMIWHLGAWIDLKFILRPDVYLSPTSYIVPALGVRNSVLIVPDLVSFLFPDQHNKKAVWVERFFLRQALRQVRQVIAISKATKADLENLLGVPEAKVQVVYLAPASAFQPKTLSLVQKRDLRKKYNLPDRFILFVGTLESRKNIGKLLKAYQDPFFSDYGLVIAGRKGWGADRVFQQVQRLGLGEKVRFLGYVLQKDLVALYNLALVLAFPSLYEGFGIPPLEAMACGTPVVTSNLSSLPEVCGKAALLVNPKKSSEIRAALKKILQDRNLKSRLIKRGFVQVKKFSWGKSAEQILKILQRCSQAK